MIYLFISKVLYVAIFSWAETKKTCMVHYIQGVPGGKVNILGGHSVGHSKQKSVYVHVSYPEWFPR
jgi:hypothetical protein